MGLQTLLGRFVVIGNHHQRPIRAEAGRGLGRLHRLSGAVAAGSRQQARPLPDHLAHRLEQPVLFVPAEGGRFAGGAADHQPVAALIDQMQSQLGRETEMNRAISLKRGDKRRHQSSEGRLTQGRTSRAHELLPAISSSAIWMALRAAPLRI